MNLFTKLFVFSSYLNFLEISAKNITLNDVFISVITSKAYSTTRLPIILKTWFQIAREQTWFYTEDENLARLQRVTSNHMVHTKCSPKNTCCKTTISLNFYLRFSSAKWYCQFQDKSYVNVPRLLEVLQSFNYRKTLYLGKSAIEDPMVLPNGNPFWYASFEAGYCLSRTMALRMQPLVRSGSFLESCKNRGEPDETIGFTLGWVYKTFLVNVPYFHGPSETSKALDPAYYSEQISFTYGKKNVINQESLFSKPDPTRMFSLHCTLFPKTDSCLYLERKLGKRQFEQIGY